MAKKPTRPRKFRQARKDALAEAKKSFSGKKQAGLKDRTLKISADDKEVLSEMRKEAKGGYITDDRGNKIQVKPTETAQERIARDRREAKAQLQRQWDQEDGKARAPKETPAKTTTPKPRTEMSKVRTMVEASPVKPQGKVVKKTVEKKASTKKSSVKKPSVGGTAGTTAKPKAGLMNQIKKDVAKVNAKSMTRAEKSAANKAAWAKMTPAERKNWSASKPAAAPKTVATTPKVKTGVAAKGELKTAAEVDKYKEAVAQGKSKGEAVRIAKGGSANLPAVLPKKGAGTVATTGAKSAAAKKLTAAGVLKAVGKGAWKATGGKVGMGLTAAALLAEPIHKALSKDTKGRTTWDLLNEGKLRPAPKTTADYGRAVPGGGKGKAAAAAAGVTAGAAAMKQRSNQPRITGQGKYRGKSVTFGGGGTTSVYKVETGDTLSGIAKKAGVTLAELMEANKKIKDPRKIYRNTTVKIPAKGKMPTPMYTGPVPYVPGSKAAKAYEASRKK